MASNNLDSPSVDSRELAHYEKLANTWWDPTGPFWPLHTLNKLRVKWITKQIIELMPERQNTQLPLEGLSVLDVGCGGGILSESLASLGAKVLGIDVVEKNIHVAKKHAEKQNLNVDYQLITVESLQESIKKSKNDLETNNLRFDIVFNMEVVEHVADLQSFMGACNDLVKPGGFTFVATINRNWFAWFIAIVGAEYILRWLPKGTHHYSMLRKPSEIKNILLKDDFSINKTSGVVVNPLNKTMKLINSLWVNYMVFAIKDDSVK